MGSNDQIIISKSKLYKTVGITLGVVLFLVISFMVSSNNSEEYKDGNSSVEQNEEDLYEIALKDAASVVDEKRKNPKEISIDDYINLYNEDGGKIVLLSRPTCNYCQIATPILENIIYETDIEINYINTNELDDDGNKKLVSSDEYFNDGFGTPLLLVVGDGEIKDKIEGLTTKDNYISFFEKNKFLE